MNTQLQNGTAKRGRAKTRADVAKRWQTVTIFAIGRYLKADVNKLCCDRFLCRVSELSRAAADEFIEGLKTLRAGASG